MPIRVFLMMLLVAAAAVARASATDSGGQDCALCHLEWSAGFGKPGAVLLIDRPEKSTAGDSRSCLGCHDGSVADSRCKVWFEPGHKPGTIPPPTMNIPKELPLDDGKITCRTCHTAHATGSSGSFADTIFLRMKNDRGQLCNACHADEAAGPKTGSHPVTKMDIALPQSLADLGARGGGDNHQVVCQSCHAAHGGTEKKQLVRGADVNQLCLGCHEQLKPLMWKPGTHEHRLDMPVQDAAQRKAIADMGTSLGPDGKLTCLSCHKVHHGTKGEAMLADTLSESRLCIRCHPGRASMMGSTHDLRKSAPAELNVRKQTADQSGPCGSCHTVHSYTRALTPRDGDPQGLCTTCHSDGQVASKHTGLPLSHPGEVDQNRLPSQTALTLYPSKDDPSRKALACLTCHDPHDTRHPDYLRKSSEMLCADCHGDKTRSLASSHDFTASGIPNGLGRSGTEAGKCGFCHSVHKANGPAMWAATAQRPASADETCTLCHRKDGIAGKTPAAMFNHPTAGAHPTTQQSLPLFDEKAHLSAKGSMACATCHDPHVGSSPKQAMLRKTSGDSLCRQCHPDQFALVGGSHDPAHSSKQWPARLQPSGDVCGSCHVTHSNDPARENWTVPLVSWSRAPDRSCLACHPEQLWADAEKGPEPGTTIHPTRVPDGFAKHIPAALPLEHGAAGSPSAIACRTCHNPHSGKNSPSMLRNVAGGPPGQLCISCHSDQRSIQASMHASEILNQSSHDPAGCAPCHSTHATDQTAANLPRSTGDALSAAKLTEQFCLRCHGSDGTATRLAAWQHPATFLGRGGPPTTRPSSDRSPAIAAINDITCSTCHLPHGKAPVQPAPAGTSLTEIRTGWKLMLKPDIDRQLCASCHGIDASRLFLYFHNRNRGEVARQMLDAQEGRHGLGTARDE